MLLTLKSEVDVDTGEPLSELTPPCREAMVTLGLPHVHTVTEALAEVEQNPQGALATAIQEGIERYE